MDYPQKLIRGISSNEFIDEDGRALGALFKFEDSPRDDELCECSINWLDDCGAAQVAFEQKKSDSNEYQFKIGIAIMNRAWIDDLKRKPNCQGALDYERAPLENNPYHGNLLCKNFVTRSQRNLFTASIAMCVENIVYRAIS
jgi:hypothetical protein